MNINKWCSISIQNTGQEKILFGEKDNKFKTTTAKESIRKEKY